MIASTRLGPGAAIIDVGAGASTFVDGLLDHGFHKITALDISSEGLDIAKARLGARAGGAHWLVADITNWVPPVAAFDLWHDRAVFHFLIDPKDREAYIHALKRALRPGGYLILATFALTGPERCSGLPVRRYSPETLQAALGADFRLLRTSPETHRTPGGTEQDFVWCLFQAAT
jgi:SAM-dependent methyltransferase